MDEPLKLNANGEEKVSYSKEELALINRVVGVKVKMLAEHPFFGILLQNAKFAVSDAVKTACTDGEYITFGLKFCSSLSDEGLYFVAFHEIMHIVLGHCFRGEGYQHTRYNIAADTVINSQILLEMGLDDIDLGNGVSLFHLAPNGKEGRLYTTEEIYQMLEEQEESQNGQTQGQSGQEDAQNEGDDKEQNKGNKKRSGQEDGQNDEKNGADNGDKTQVEKKFDDHSLWGSLKDPTVTEQIWKSKMIAAEKVADEVEKGWGDKSSMIKRVLEKIKNPPLDWRSILHQFIQEEINDYSFAPPDRRFQDSPFLLPDYNEKDERPKNIWIAIDASGSVTNKQLGLAYNEIVGAIDQFGGKLEGYISFFDVEVSTPEPFSSIEDLERIKPVGAGGTSFKNLFKYFKEEITFDVSSIIVITDGYSEYPDEAESLNTPVLWVLNNNLITPPWGEVVRIKK